MALRHLLKIVNRGVRKSSCRCSLLFGAFPDNRRMAFKSSLDGCTFMPWLLDYFDLASNGSGSRKRYTLTCCSYVSIRRYVVVQPGCKWIALGKVCVTAVEKEGTIIFICGTHFENSSPEPFQYTYFSFQLNIKACIEAWVNYDSNVSFSCDIY